ncbi:MAG: TrkH family potassium uptake protein [Planctomycetales bacterium]|nr:TrkH family potassium uptake protein [Planctomycetales bacterium]
MNTKLLAKHLGTICLLIAMAMGFSLPWALPQIGLRGDIPTSGEFEADGFRGLLISISICVATGFVLRWFGRDSAGHLFRKEAMAIVGLSWVLATVMGGLPYCFTHTYRAASIRLANPLRPVQLYAYDKFVWEQWVAKAPVDEGTFAVLSALLDAGAKGLPSDQLESIDRQFASKLLELTKDSDWQACIRFPGTKDQHVSYDCLNNYRIRWIRTGFVDSLFESQSGFSTTGATVFSDLEDPRLIPHCILFWRSSTHFLGGLGIVVLFVVVLGHGSAGKAMMRAEVTGASGPTSQSRTQHVAWTFAGIYGGLNGLLTVLLKLEGLTWFNALCHAFGTMATGGFSTYNASAGHFDSSVVHYTIILFMIIAGMNFTLLYLFLVRRFREVFSDTELRAYLSIILITAVLVAAFGLAHQDYRAADDSTQSVPDAFRHSLFQVVSILTTTGFATHDFDSWNHFGRGALLVLMFIGGCAGSTGGGAKVVRHVLLFRILLLELEQAFRPSVVRTLKLNARQAVSPEMRKNTVVYICFMAVIFVTSFVVLIMIEPDSTWGFTDEATRSVDHKLIDSISAVAASLNNIGPGLGTVGATQNFGHFSSPAKLLFTWLMMLGRVEIFAILVLFVPSFWRKR